MNNYYKGDSMKTNVIDLTKKLENKNMFHNGNIIAANNLVQAAQYLLNNSSIEETLFYIEHVKDQLNNMNKTKLG